MSLIYEKIFLSRRYNNRNFIFLFDIFLPLSFSISIAMFEHGTQNIDESI